MRSGPGAGEPSHLLDTSTLVWAVGMPEKLSRVARKICTSHQTHPAVSVVSLMELIIKGQKGHLTLAPDPIRWWNDHIRSRIFGVAAAAGTCGEALDAAARSSGSG